MLTAWIIYREEDAEKNRGSIEMFQREFEKHNIFSKLIIFEKLNISEKNLCLPDIVVNRTRSCELAQFFEERNVNVFNSSRVAFVGNDKVAATKFANEVNVPTMTVYENAGDITKWPVVAKTREGHGGSEVFLVKDFEEASELNKKYDSLFFQDYSPEGNSDMRVYLVGNEIMCAICRHSDKDFRSNYSLGGTVTEVTVPKEVTEYVGRMIEELGEVAYCGMDFIRFESEWVFNEIEDMVGARSVYTYTEHDPIAAFVKYIVNKI